MNQPVTLAAVVVFALVTVVQLVRIFLEWTVIINGIVIPIWVSVIAAAIAATLSVLLWRERRPLG